jgi:alkylation response protein AidB-like acyl-CoA dehydrogenase
MPVYSAPVRETRFILDHVVVACRIIRTCPASAKPAPTWSRRSSARPARFSEEVLQPLNKVGDQHGCKRNDDGSVTTPPGFKEAWDQFVEAGWTTLHAPAEFGGQGLPSVIGTAVAEYFGSSNHSFEMYKGLTSRRDLGADRQGFGRAQANAICPNMVSGRWTGTMNLTEPHCGTDLGLLKTKAVAQRRRQLRDHRYQDLHLVGRA